MNYLQKHLKKNLLYVSKNIALKICFIVFDLLVFVSSSALADGPVVKGSNVLGVGFGPAGTYFGYGGFSPGIKVNFESGLWKAGPGTITLGGTFGFSYQRYHYGYLWGSAYNYSWTHFVLAARSAWHHNWGADNLDTYGGASVGVRFVIFNDDGDPTPNDYNTVYPHFGGFVGAAYYFKPNIGAFAEVGYDVNYLTVGLNFKFGNN